MARSMSRALGPGMLVTSVLAGAIAFAASPSPAPSAAATEFFERQVRPVLAERCYSCHGPRQQQGGLRLDTPDFLRLRKPADALVRPGNPYASRLIQAVRQSGDLKMPPDGRLPQAQIDALIEWVRSGADWPSGRMKAEGRKMNPAEGRHPLPTDHRPLATAPWSFRPVVCPPVPVVKDRVWVKTPIDAFVLSEMEKHGLRPSPPADHRTLIRRAYYDLVGLPPTADEVDAFIADRSPDAYPHLIDRLLASPQYGERWGRYWLDVARYADTRGYVRLQEERLFPFAYTYRDYVVRSFNEDKPYDRFVLEQLAADQLPAGTADPAALGFLTLGRRFTGNRHDIIDDRIDVVGRGLLGLTVTCARCHDHKYDPIPTADYYSLYGVFASSEDPAYPPLIGSATTPVQRTQLEEFERRKREADRRETAAFAALQDQFRARTGDYLARALEGPQPPQQPLPQTHDQVRQYVVERWIDRLRDSKENGEPLFAPWHAFAALKRESFRTEAAALLAKWQTTGPDHPMNPCVVDYFQEHPPLAMADVARGYGSILETVWKSVTARRQAAEERTRGLINGSFEADGPTVNRSLTGWSVTGARVVTLATEGVSDGDFAVVFGDGLPTSNPPTAHNAVLSQVVPTQPGAEYRVTFDYGAFGSGAAEAAQSLRCWVSGKATLASRTITARGSIPNVLKPYELAFVADGNRITLSFADATTNGESGVADGVLDNVRLVMVRDSSGSPPQAEHSLTPAPVSSEDQPFYDLLYGPASPFSMTRNEALDNYLYDAPVNAELFRLRNVAGALLAQTAGAPPRAHTLVEVSPSHDARILIRGNPQRAGARVPRQFLAALSGPKRTPFAPEHARLDLAREIIRHDNPLTARVIVNRVWQHHFGEGLVRTPSDFGARGEFPTHPALLDWLASAFAAGARGQEPGAGGEGSAVKARVPAVADRETDAPPKVGGLGGRVSRATGLEWSLKRLHRLIMLSNAYQMSSGGGGQEPTGSARGQRPNPQSAIRNPQASDPENRFLSRANRRRLDVEAFRDSVLRVAGQLDLRPGGPSADLLDPANRRRTLYATIDRQALPGMLRLFDFASPDAHTAQRHTTTVPLQALFLLNSPFMEAASRAVAERTAEPVSESAADRVRALYRTVLARDPTPAEQQRGIRFVQDGSWADLAQALLLSNEFSFVD